MAEGLHGLVRGCPAPALLMCACIQLCTVVYLHWFPWLQCASCFNLPSAMRCTPTLAKSNEKSHLVLLGMFCYFDGGAH